MRFLAIAFLLVVQCCGTTQADEIKPVPDPINDQKSVKPPIRIPMIPVVVEPGVIVPPVVDPKEPDLKPVPDLRTEELYVVAHTEALIIRHSRLGHVAVTAVTGPYTFFFNKFADGVDRDKQETRTYKEPFLYVVRAETSGDIELIISPAGAMDESQDVRQPLTVTVGPRPPPIPPDPPTPEPDPNPLPPTGLRVLLLYNEDANREQLNTVNSTKIVEWMTANCATSADGRPEWRRWDRTSVSKPGMLEKETPVWKKLWSDVSPTLTPGNFVVAVTDTKVTLIPMAGPDATLEALKRIKEGK